MIDTILENYVLEEMLIDFGEEEKKEFLYDLNLILNNREFE